MGSQVTDRVYDLRRHFRAGATLSIATRKRHLEAILSAVYKLEPQILAALEKDLGKSPVEGYATEVGFVIQEIKHIIAHLADWAETKFVDTPLTLITSSSRIYPQPKGVVLIISPWNYPFQLAIAPLSAAIAAGNVCVVKPSELTPHTTKIIAQLIQDSLPQDVAITVQGDASVASELLRHAWDHVFFTGSTRVGKIVAKACAEHLTPMTLELGGKSPAIIDETANIKHAAKRIVWGKFVNAGQTCTAPDYILIHESIKDKFVTHCLDFIKAFYGQDPKKSSSYGRIINHDHYDRLTAMITGGSKIHGGNRDRVERYIEPTIIEGVGLDHPAMAEEIFGPIMPIITWREKGQMLTLLDANPNPLALYVFSKDRAFQDELITTIPFGGGCMNHTLMHLSNPELPFGGVRQSGLGAYHGEAGFKEFTHYKSVLHAGIIDDSVKYPPYASWKLKLLRLIQGGKL